MASSVINLNDTTRTWYCHIGISVPGTILIVNRHSVLSSNVLDKMKLPCSYWICSWLLLSLLAINEISASKSTPSRRGWFGRPTKLKVNTTTVNKEEEEEEDNNIELGEKQSKGGIFHRPSRKDQKKLPPVELDEDEVDDSTRLDMNHNETTKDIIQSKKIKASEEDSATKVENTSTEHTQVNDRDKKRGRGPFGFFKPVDQVKKNGEKEKVEQSKSKEQLPVTDDTIADADENDSSATNSTPPETGAGEGEDKAAIHDLPVAANTTTTTTTSSGDSNSLAVAKPRFIVLGTPGSNDILPHRSVPSRYGRGFPPPSPQIDHQALIVASVAAAVNAATRIWLIVWLARRLSAEDELLAPEQHFRWECLNDRYSKDATVLNSVLSKPPLGFSHLKWGKYLRELRPKKNSSTSPGPQLPTKSVVVVDITPTGNLDMSYLTDVVNFLVSSHNKMQFGTDPEIVLLMESPGGGVSIYGLAAAQVGRLKQIGLNVTICIDMVAASGGYMIATQATKLVAAPFAQLGSIGVMAEGLNFNKLLSNYGVKPMVLKAGDQKNRLSAYGPVTDEDLEAETLKLEKIHEAFIQMCLKERPCLDPTVCDGTVMVASQGIQHGIVDRVLTSEEYIWECIQNGAHVLKLHKSSMRPHPNYFLFRAMDLLPHLKKTIRQLDTGKLLAVTVQTAAFAGMILRSLR